MAKKKPLSTPEIDPERETRVLLEGVRSEVKIVAEQHESVVKRMERIENQVGLVKMAVLDSNSEIKILKDDVRILKRGQEDLKKGQEDLKKGYEDVKKGQEGLATKVNRIEQKLDTVIVNHEDRLHKLEAAQ